MTPKRFVTFASKVDMDVRSPATGSGSFWIARAVLMEEKQAGGRRSFSGLLANAGLLLRVAR
jgi:hypothetical protein